MKKVLIIAYYYPPHPAIGSQRPYRLAKYLQRLGWEPIVLTVEHPGKVPDGIRVIATKYTDIIASLRRAIGLKPNDILLEKIGIPITKNFEFVTLKGKIIKFLRYAIAFPDPERGWYQYAVKAASDLLDKERVAAIVSTSPPETTHLIARKLKQKYNIPWIADFRDLWMQNELYDKASAVKYFEKRLERKVLSDADAFVTISEPHADLLKAAYGCKNVFCVTNGYDADDFMQAASSLTEKFTITYTGSLYNGRRDPSTLFETVQRLIKAKKIDKEHIEICFFCPREGWLADEINKYDLNDIVALKGTVPREEALKKQKESQLLLLLFMNAGNEKGVYTGKLFEYLGARRPIISVGGSQGVVKELLQRSMAGRYAENAHELEDSLLHYYQEYIESGEVRYAGNEYAERYTYDVIAQKYSGILNNLVLAGRK